MSVMTPGEREALDARILEALAAAPNGVSFTALAVRLGFNDSNSKSENSFRKVDQRLQALRKRGVIATVKQTWRLAPAAIPVEASVDVDEPEESNAPKG